ncbi:MAG: SBBP repeat-containing protein [Bacteroidia bacterium]|nr:SBBP repeat-containing protein [Bacteroidia bacterium]
MQKLFRLFLLLLVCNQCFAKSEIIEKKFTQSTLAFVQNKGQIIDTEGKVRSDILFYAQLKGVQVYFSKEKISYVYPLHDLNSSKHKNNGLWRMDVEFVNANSECRISAEDAKQFYLNYYLAHKQITNIPTFGKIIYHNIYPHVDLIFYTLPNGALKYDFIIKPGGNPQNIRLKYIEGGKTTINTQGEFIAIHPAGTLTEKAPWAYQENNTNVFSKYVFNASNQILSFEIGNYNTSKNLVIDPVVSPWSTYYGTANIEEAYGIGTAPNGNVVVCGYTNSSVFPVLPGATQPNFGGGGEDAFVIQFNSDGTPLWATYYGGSANDRAFGVDVDNNNNIYFTGQTASSNFPGASSYNGGDDIFAVKLNNNGQLVWATLFGGATDDVAYEIAIDNANNLIVTGYTTGPEFPAFGGAFQNTFAGGETDAIVVKFNENGVPLWATFYGGSSKDIATSLDIDSNNNIYFVGYTLSENFPTQNAFQNSNNGEHDCFAVRLSALGQRQWATYIGGSSNDEARAISVDPNNNVIIVGWSNSTDFNVTGGFQTTYGGNDDAIIIKLNSNGTRLWATYAGGSSSDKAYAVTTDEVGGIYLTGETRSTNFRQFANTPGPFQVNRAGGEDAFILELSAGGTPVNSSYYGGRQTDIGQGIAISSNRLYICGWTISSSIRSGGNFPVPINAYQPEWAGERDAFITRFDLICETPPPTPTVNAVSGCGTASATITITNVPNEVTEVRLYSSRFSSTPIARATSRPFILTTPTVSTTTTFFIESFIDERCVSERAELVLNVNPFPGAPLSNNVTRCGPGSVTFTAEFTSPAGTQIHLYTQASGGSAIAFDPTPPYTLTANVNNTTTFYLEAFNSNTGCTSLTRTVVVANVLPLPAPPIANNVSRCGAGQVIFTAQQGNPPGNGIRIYTTAIGGTEITSRLSPPFELAVSPTVTTTYFLESFIQEFVGCNSSTRTQVVATVHPLPGLPPAGNVSRCGPGAVNITAAFGNPSGTEMRIYNVPSGGTPLEVQNTPPFNFIQNITTTTVFYLEAFSSITGCTSLRNSITASVNNNPGAPIGAAVSRCGAGAITISAQMGNPPGTEIRLYSVSSGGNVLDSDATTPYTLSTTVSNSGQLFLEVFDANTRCTSTTRTPVNVTVTSPPSAPTGEAFSRCGAGTVFITAGMGFFAGREIRLYEQGSGGTPIAIDNFAPYQFTVNITTTTTFFLESYDVDANGGPCPSSRTQVVAVINPLPGAPTSSNVSRCGAGFVTFTANLGTPAGNSIRLFTDPFGGLPLASAFNAPYLLSANVTTTTIFYLETLNTTTGCVSQNRTPVVATVNIPPAPPIVNNVARCGPGTVTIFATMGNPPGTDVFLYSQPTGGNILASDFIEPFDLGTNVTTTTTFYVESFSIFTNCASTSRTAVTVTVNPIPGTPSASAVQRCGPGIITITANMGIPSAREIRLYSQPTGGEAIAIDNTPPYELSATINTTTTLYIESYTLDVSGVCTSNRTSVVATVNENPGPPSALIAFSRCGAGTITFTAQMGTPTGNQIHLFSQPTGGPSLGSNNTPPYSISTNITTTTIFYIESRNTTTGCISLRSPVVATVNPTPGAPSANNVTRCGAGEIVFTTQMGAPTGTEIRLYTLSSGGTIIASDAFAPYDLATNITTTTTFFLESFDITTGCASTTRSSVVGIAASPPALPDATNVTRCGAGSVTFSATMGNPAGTEIRLYTTEVGGTALAIDNQAPYLLSTTVTTTTTFFLESFNTNIPGGCASNRRSITAIVNELPGIPPVSNISRCGTGFITLTIANGTPPATDMRLYTVATGGNFIQNDGTEPFNFSINLTTNSTFYIESFNRNTGCISTNRATLVVSISPLPGSPRAQGVARCGFGEVIFTAEMGTPAGREIRLYATPVGGVPISTALAPPYTLNATVFTTTTFYLESYDVDPFGVCASTRTPIIATVNPLPGIPFAETVARCGSGAITLSFNIGEPAGDQIVVYTLEQGGSSIGSVFSPFTFSTTITTTTTFYAESRNTQTGCISPARSAVLGIVHPIPGNPTANTLTRCGPGAVRLTAKMGEPAGTEILLYTLPFAGTAARRDDSFPYEIITPIINETGNIFITARDANTGCESERVLVRVIISQIMNLTAVTTPATTGDNGTLTVSVTGGIPPYRYSITGCDTGQTSNVFTNLLPGAYVALVKDSLECVSTVYAFVPEGFVGLCSAPTNISVRFDSPGQVTLSWSSNNQAFGYAYQIRKIGDTFWQPLQETTNNFITLRNLEGESYEFRVRSNCGNQFSEFTTISFVLRGCDLTRLTAFNETSSSADLSWSPVFNAIRYEIRYAPAGTSNFIELQSSNSSTTLTNLLPNTIYNVCVRSICTNNSVGQYICVNFVTQQGFSSCNAPTGLSVFNATTTSATISWIRVPEANSYILRYRREGTADWLILRTANTPATITNLLPNTTYEVQAASVCAGISSPFSPTLRINTFQSGSRENAVLASERSLLYATVYPNPNIGEFYISIQNAKTSPAQIRIFDFSGKVVYQHSWEVENSSIEKFVSLENIPRGIYLLEISQENYKLPPIKLIIQ